MKRRNCEIRISPAKTALSGRQTWRVVCRACLVVVHEGTTAPDIRVREHLAGSPGYERPLRAGEATHAT